MDYNYEFPSAKKCGKIENFKKTVPQILRVVENIFLVTENSSWFPNTKQSVLEPCIQVMFYRLTRLYVGLYIYMYIYMSAYNIN